MGMSASQMRYTLLSGRQNDVEFQGQQINQQRTTLASESNALNNQLLNLSVPTPPSTDDYTTTNYSFSNNSKTNTITSAVLNDNGTYDINYSYNTTGDGPDTGVALFVKTTDGTYKTGSSTLAATTSADSANLSALYGNDYDQNKQYFVFHDNNDTTKPAKYISETELVDAMGTNNSAATEFHFINPNSAITKNGKISGAIVTWSGSGRMESFSANNRTYQLNVKNTTDENAYTNAMNEYDYQKQKYEQDMNDINSKIDVIQQDDKKLELKLKDLDTQQEALSTEKDSVKKVIDKNIESSFKAFA